MSLRRSLHSRAFTPEAIFRFASVMNQPIGRRPLLGACGLCRSCYEQRNHTGRRLSTFTEYRPHSLEQNPPPPRNTNVADTSITGLAPEVSSPRKQATKTLQDPSSSPSSTPSAPPSVPTSTATSQETPNASLPESKAQKTRPAPSSHPPPPPTTTPKPQRTSRLRSRKAAMSVTPTAITQLRNLLSQPEPKMIRVGVRNRGCSGLAYHLEYVDKPGTFDETVEQDGVKVLIDSKALFSIIGSEMDWVEDKLNERFVFRNPNIKEQCGCGESFMV